MAVKQLRFVIDAQDNASAKFARIENMIERMAIRMVAVSIPLMEFRRVMGDIEKGLEGIAKGVIETGAAFDRLSTQLYPIVGSQRAVAAQFAAINQQFGQGPLGIDAITQGYIALRQQGINPTARGLKVMGDYAVYTGQKFEAVVKHVQQLKQSQFTRAFQGMEAMAGGSQARAYETPEGRLQAIRNSVTSIFQTLYGYISKPILNVLEMIRRAFVMLQTSGVIEAIGQRIQSFFSIEHIRTWAKAVVDVFYTIKDVATNLFEQTLLLMRQMTARAQEMLHAIKGAFLFVGGDKAGSQAELGQVDRYGKQAQSARSQLEALTAHPIVDRAGRNMANAFIDRMSKGLNDKPIRLKPMAPINAFDPFGKDATGRAMDFGFGGGPLARFGVKASQMGAGFQAATPGAIRIDITGADAQLREFVRQVIAQYHGQLLKKGYIMLPARG